MEKLFKRRVIYDQINEETDNYNEAATTSESDPEDDESFVSEYDDEDEEKSMRTSCKRLKLQNGGVAVKKSSRNKNNNNNDGNDIARKPTRRPDPKVSNRNALMARENRKRKKEMFEKLEQRFNDIQTENRNLKRLSKRQGTTIKKLHNETLYLRSVISNRTQIAQLLKSIGSSNIPITSKLASSKSATAAISEFKYSPATPDSLRGSSENNYGIGNNQRDPLLSQSSIFIDTLNTFPITDGLIKMEAAGSSPGYSSEDTLDAVSSFDEGWENLLNYNESISDIPIFDEEHDFKGKSSCIDIVSEHNYHTNINENFKRVEPGVCLHVTSGRVSLEFCASCHNSAQQTEIEEY